MLDIVIMTTKTSYLNICADLNDFGLGFQLCFKSSLYRFNSFTFHLLMFTIYVEWAIEQYDDSDGGEDDGEQGS